MSKPQPSYTEARVGSLIDRRYEIGREIARGGMGVVFEAAHRLTKQSVAIKLLADDVIGWSSARDRLLREARAIALSRHPNVVGVLDAGQCDEHGPYVVLEMIEGRSLESFLLSRLSLDLDTVVTVAVQLGAALAHVHRQGVVHRDVKPANVLVSRAPGAAGDVIKLVDFGVSCVAGQDDVTDRKLTRDKDVVGTVEYMAPEQVLDHAPPSPATDIYGMGVTLYELLTGDVPFPGPLAAVMNAHVRQWVIPSIRRHRNDVPPALESAILRALSRDPSQRFATAEELARACVSALGRQPRSLALLASLETGGEGTRRQHARAPYVTLTRIVSASGVCDGRTEDVSEGGLLVITQGSCGEGARVAVRLSLPRTGRVVNLEAIARWASSQRGQRAIGLEFLALPDDIRDEIRLYVKHMGKTQEAPSVRPAPAVRVFEQARAIT